MAQVLGKYSLLLPVASVVVLLAVLLGLQPDAVCEAAAATEAPADSAQKTRRALADIGDVALQEAFSAMKKLVDEYHAPAEGGEEEALSSSLDLCLGARKLFGLYERYQVNKGIPASMEIRAPVTEVFAVGVGKLAWVKERGLHVKFMKCILDSVTQKYDELASGKPIKRAGHKLDPDLSAEEMCPEA